MSKEKGLTEFQKRVVLAVQKRSARDIIVSGMDIAALCFAETWRKNTKSHGRLVGRVRQEVHRLEKYLCYHPGRDQWSCFGASLNRTFFICQNCASEIEGCVKIDDLPHCSICWHTRSENPTEYRARTKTPPQLATYKLD
jgi:hypothetical protein